MGRGTKTCLGCGVVLLLATRVVCALGSVPGPLISSLVVASLTANLGSSVAYFVTPTVTFLRRSRATLWPMRSQHTNHKAL